MLKMLWSLIVSFIFLYFLVRFTIEDALVLAILVNVVESILLPTKPFVCVYICIYIQMDFINSGIISFEKYG
jgi:nucleoside recognition membrane protein YjiH